MTAGEEEPFGTILNCCIHLIMTSFYLVGTSMHYREKNIICFYNMAVF